MKAAQALRAQTAQHITQKIRNAARFHKLDTDELHSAIALAISERAAGSQDDIETLTCRAINEASNLERVPTTHISAIEDESELRKAEQQMSKNAAYEDTTGEAWRSPAIGILAEDATLPSKIVRNLMRRLSKQSQVAHASLLRGGVADWYLHNRNFLRICRGLQRRFGVVNIGAEFCNDYDQQDIPERKRICAAASIGLASGISMVTDYDPTVDAQRIARDIRDTDRRHWMRMIIIPTAMATLAIAAVSTPWAAVWAWLDGDGVKLLGGVALIAWLSWFSIR